MIPRNVAVANRHHRSAGNRYDLTGLFLVFFFFFFFFFLARGGETFLLLCFGPSLPQTFREYCFTPLGSASQPGKTISVLTVSILLNCCLLEEFAAADPARSDGLGRAKSG